MKIFPGAWKKGLAVLLLCTAVIGLTHQNQIQWWLEDEEQVFVGCFAMLDFFGRPSNEQVEIGRQGELWRMTYITDTKDFVAPVPTQDDAAAAREKGRGSAPMERFEVDESVSARKVWTGRDLSPDEASNFVAILRSENLYDNTPAMGVSGILCKRGGHQISERRSPNSMVNRVNAAFQSRMGIDHFTLMLRSAK